jgi:oxygen-dependent protoporphyrinogen oxidase
MTRVVIAGGGIAGLSIARAISQREPNTEVVVLERNPRAGGNIRTEHIDGYICEAGPDGFLDSAAATLALVRAIGLESRLLPSNDAARKRYIVSRGRLCEVPASVGAFLKTPLLSARGKLRIACEPFVMRHHDVDESIHEFASRRIGHEAASVLVDPMVAGIFAGDASALSLRACFPRMWQLEEDHGGLFRALLATRRARRRDDTPGAPPGRLTSFTGGMADLIDALTRELGAAIHTSTPVMDLCQRNPIAIGHRMPSARRYAVRMSADTIDADAVVLSGPAAESAAILRGIDPVLATLLQSIPSAPLAVVCLGYDAPAIASQCKLDGFGFLVPRSEGIRILGALWETSIYQNRAPANKALMRVMIGGARDRHAASLPDEELLGIVRKDLAWTMGLSVAPEFVRIIRHPRGIPQYVKGHLARVHQIDALLERHPGLYLAGNSYRGVSINSCIAEADRVAEAVLQQVAAGRPAPDCARTA